MSRGLGVNLFLWLTPCYKSIFTHCFLGCVLCKGFFVVRDPRQLSGRVLWSIRHLANSMFSSTRGLQVD